MRRPSGRRSVEISRHCATEPAKRLPSGSKVLLNGYRRGIGSVELGRFIVANRAIHGGAPTFRGTCIRVTDVLHELYQAVPPDEIVERLGGKVTRDMLSDALELERQILEQERRREIAEQKRGLRSASA